MGIKSLLNADKALKQKPPSPLKVRQRLLEAGYRNGLIFRAFADDIIGFAPPLCCTKADIDLLVTRFEVSLNHLLTIKEIRNEVD